MALHTVKDIDGLKQHIYAALQLEHATLPPYLTALYSLHPGTNTEAFHVIRTVAVEEMLHLTLAANLMNAVGGKVDLTAPGFVPQYPAYLPDGEEDFQVDCAGFSRSTIETFLKIERPAELIEGAPRTVNRTGREGTVHASWVDKDGEEHFHSIGEFYKAIALGLEHLHKEHGDALFCGDPARQITSDYYYSGGGEIIAVTDLESALAAIDLIGEQGEGVTNHIFDEEGEIAHYYRFQQLLLGRFYREGDEPNAPTGGVLEVDWDAAYPIRKNARLSDYPEGSAIRAQAEAFDRRYAEFLKFLTAAFDGKPEMFIPAIGGMFELKELFAQLIRQPLDDEGTLFAAPAFDIETALGRT